MLTVTAAVVVDGNQIKGFAVLAHNGDTYRREFDIATGLDPHRLDPPHVASILSTPVIETVTLAIGKHPAYHGWGMPYSSLDDLLMVFEFDFDNPRKTCEHGFDLNGRCPVED